MTGTVRTATPVTVLTGFLGSGKTTLVSTLLRHPDAGRVAIIVNELGEIGIDDLLVEPVAEDVALVGGGCLCCSVRGDLLAALDGLLARREAGTLPPFDRVVVETTGLADPAPVLHTLMGARGPLPGACLAGLVTVVDGVEGARQLDRHRECARQVALADRLVISKADLVTPGWLDALEQRLGALNPWAPMLRSAMGSVGPSDIFAGAAAPSRPAAWRVRKPAPESGAVEAPDPHAGDTRAFCVTRAQPFSRAVLGMWLSRVLARLGDRVLRVKGLVAVAGSPGPLVVNAVQHRLYPPGRLGAWPSADHRSRLVFIVTGDLEREVTGILTRLEEEHGGGWSPHRVGYTT